MSTYTKFLPQGRAFTWIEPAMLEKKATRDAYAYWVNLCADRPWPAREEMKMRDMTSFASHMALLRVLNDGEDFEHRIVGDAMVCAFDIPIQNRRFSEIAVDAPKLIAESFALFRKVVTSGAPLAWHHRVVDDEIHIVYSVAEMILLPFGRDLTRVDHVAAFGVYSRITDA